MRALYYFGLQQQKNGSKTTFQITSFKFGNVTPYSSFIFYLIKMIADGWVRLKQINLIKQFKRKPCIQIDGPTGTVKA